MRVIDRSLIPSNQGFTDYNELFDRGMIDVRKK